MSHARGRRAQRGEKLATIGALFALAIALIVVGAANAVANPLSWASKGSKAARSAAAVATLTKAQAATLAAGLGAGAIFLELRGGRLLLQSLDDAAVGIEGPVAQAGALARSAQRAGGRQFVISSETAAALGSRLDDLLDAGPVHVAEPGLGMTLPVVRPPGQSAGHLKQIRDNLLAPVDARLGPEFAQLLVEPVRREQLRVVSIFARSDADSLRQLTLAAGDAMADTQQLLKALDSGKPGALRGKTLILVGHIEDGAFAMREAGGTVVKVNIAKLEALAKASDIQMIAAGCQSFCAGARIGYADPVTATEMAAAVRQSFAADTVADLLQAFGRERPLIVTQQAIDQFVSSGSLHVGELARGTELVRAGGLSVRVYSMLNKAEGSALQALGGWYLTGSVALLLMIRSSRAAFMRVFPQLPSPLLPETRARHFAARTGREFLFVALGPIFAAACLFTFFFGGWPHREDITAALWRMVRHPVSGTAAVLRTLLFVLGFMLAYGLGIMLLAAPAVMMFAVADGVDGTAWYVPAVTGALALLALGGWLGWKAHKAVNERLG